MPAYALGGITHNDLLTVTEHAGFGAGESWTQWKDDLFRSSKLVWSQAAPESDVPRLLIRPSQLNGNVPSKTDETDYLRDNAFLFYKSGKTQYGLAAHTHCLRVGSIRRKGF